MANTQTYRNKRNFAVTNEPSGTRAAHKADKRTQPNKARGYGAGKAHKRKSAARRFVVQYHLARREHYDFRLEWEGVLLSWAVPKGPSYNPRDKRLAVHVEDHPVEYADFEGIIPKGQYGGGTVMLWDEGTWEANEPFAAGLKKGSLKFSLHGKRLQGDWALVRMQTEDGDNWLLLKERDDYVRTAPGINKYVTSVRTRRTADEIAADGRKNPIRRAEVMLAKLADEVPEGDGWVYEVKYDGYRILAFIEGGKARLLSRNGHDYTHKFPAVARSLADFSDGRAMVLDGEMVLPDSDGRTDFQALQRYLKTNEGDPVYMAFDLLAVDGRDVRDEPLLSRKERLAALLAHAPDDIKYSAHVHGQGRKSFEAAAEMGFEGIVGKRADAPYVGSRSDDWIKLKCYRRQEFVIGGFTRTAKRADGLSALLLGVYEGDELVYAGKAGTGFDRAAVTELLNAFGRRTRKAPPFARPPAPHKGETVVWLRPDLLAEVQFAEWTDDGVLRQASYKGLRTDKAATEAVRESDYGQQRRAGKPAGTGRGKRSAGEPDERAARDNGRSGKRKPATDAVAGVTITSPDRVVFERPKITKRAVVAYYEKAAGRLMKYAGNRLMSVVRCHDGVAGGFYKKHPDESPKPGIRTVPVTNADNETSDYFALTDIRGLIAEAQAGSVEFHVWGSHIESLDCPDMMVFDLDPDEGLSLERVRQGVRDLRSVLRSLGLTAFLKTSGGKGYHVVVPFAPAADWDAFRAFARSVADLMAERWPDRYTANIRKVNRKGKIFIDYARNTRGATGVAPYSLRARPGAKVSCPIAWKELDAVPPDGVNLFGALERLRRPDPWRNFGKNRKSLLLFLKEK